MTQSDTMLMVLRSGPKPTSFFMDTHHQYGLGAEYRRIMTDLRNMDDG